MSYVVLYLLISCFHSGLPDVLLPQSNTAASRVFLTPDLKPSMMLPSHLGSSPKSGFDLPGSTDLALLPFSPTLILHWQPKLFIKHRSLSRDISVPSTCQLFPGLRLFAVAGPSFQNILDARLLLRWSFQSMYPLLHHPG